MEITCPPNTTWTIPYRYQILLFGYFSFASSVIIVLALALGIYVKELTAFLIFGLISSYCYERYRTGVMTKRGDQYLEFPFSNLSTGRIIGEITTLERVFDQAIDQHWSVTITIPNRRFDRHLLASALKNLEDKYIPFKIVNGSHRDSTLHVTLEEGAPLLYLSCNDLRALSRKTNLLISKGWHPSGSTIHHQSWFAPHQWIQLMTWEQPHHQISKE